MSEEDIACNYASLQDHGKRIKQLQSRIDRLYMIMNRVPALKIVLQGIIAEELAE